jgi:hypothetical protein
MKPYLNGIGSRQGTKSPFRQTSLQRHLTAFETDFVETTGTGMLTLVTTTTGFTKPRADTTTDTFARWFASHSRFNTV